MQTFLLMLMFIAVGWALRETRDAWWPHVKGLLIKLWAKVNPPKV